MFPGIPGSKGPAGATGPAGSVTSNFESVLLGLSPTRCYALSNAGSGTTETDLGSDAQDGTWSASGASQVSGMVIGNTKKAALFNGVAGTLSIPTTNLPTGAGLWTIGILFKELSRGATLQMAWMLGTSGASLQAVSLDWGTNALEVSDVSGSITSNWPTNLRLTSWMLLIATYDGTNLAMRCNGSPITSQAAALNIAYGHAAIGSDSAVTPARFANMVAQYWFLLKGSVITTQQEYSLLSALLGN